MERSTDLQGRALDAAVAERVMGRLTAIDDYGNLVSIAAGEDPNDDDAPLVPHYSTSHDAVATVRAEIERRGLERQFLSEMIAIVGYTEWTAWRIINASPEQQCRAALKAVEGAHA